ncbi:MAG: transglutaminase domain-containing protein [Clostridia bacterium]|nr:transglutaminase domain-containing protein [Clostridia bacterium]
MRNSYLNNLVNNAQENETIKKAGSISFSEIIEYVKGGISDDDFNSLCADIKSGEVSIGMDASAVSTLLASKDDSQVKRLFQSVKMPKIDIDLNSVSELPVEDFRAIRSMGVNVGKVYVNSGWDEAAAKGYTPDVYETIASRAEAMVDKAKDELAKKNPEKSFDDMSDRDKFMMIYNMVIKRAKYNYAALSTRDKSHYTARNLEDFFCNGGSAVCAGFADALVQLGTMMGLEIEYVQGDSKSAKMSHKEYHAWVRVKIDGEWYNADPTWDANHVKGKYGYCLKSDAEFDGHTLDRNYNPTYRRDKNGRLIGSSRDNGYRDYDTSTRSYRSSELIDEYYTDDLDRQMAGFRHLTEEQAAALGAKYIPNAPGSAGLLTGNNFLTVIFNFLIKITSMPAKVASKIKEKFRAGKIDAAKLSDSSYIDGEVEKAEQEAAFEDIQVDPKQAGSYKDKAQSGKDKNTQESEQDRG